MARNTRVEEILKGSKSQDRFKNLRKRGRNTEHGNQEIGKRIYETGKSACCEAEGFFLFLLFT